MLGSVIRLKSESESAVHGRWMSFFFQLLVFLVDELSIDAARMVQCQPDLLAVLIPSDEVGEAFLERAIFMMMMMMMLLRM